MNTSLRTFGLLLPLALGLAQAETPPSVLTLGGAGWRDDPVEWTASSGDPLVIEVLIPDGVDLASVWIDLRQVAGRITLPLGEAKPLADVIIGPTQDAYGITTLRIEMPAVERLTAVVIRYGTGEGLRTILGHTRVMVYPEIDWRPLGRRLAADGSHLLIFGPGTELRKWFKDNGLPYADLGEKLPEISPAGALLIGTMPASEWNDRKDTFASGETRMVVFVADSAELPGVFTTTTPGGSVLTKVTLPVPAALGRDRRGEETLLHLLEQHLSPASGQTLQRSP